MQFWIERDIFLDTLQPIGGLTVNGYHTVCKYMPKPNFWFKMPVKCGCYQSVSIFVQVSYLNRILLQTKSPDRLCLLGTENSSLFFSSCHLELGFLENSWLLLIILINNNRNTIIFSEIKSSKWLGDFTCYFQNSGF